MSIPEPLWPHGHPPTERDPACTDPVARDAIPTLAAVAPGAPGERRPAVIVLPGGAYRRHAPHEADPVAHWLHGLGLAAFVLRYRVWPNRHPAPEQDVDRAIRTVRERADEWGVDPTRVGVLGFSAGGHCAATAACHGRDAGRPDVAILCYALLDLATSHAGSLAVLLGSEPDPVELRRLTLTDAVHPGHPPTFLWTTADDGSVEVAKNALPYATALRRNGVPFALHVYPSGRHGLGLADESPEVAAWTTACASWLASRGWIAAQRDSAA